MSESILDQIRQNVIEGRRNKEDEGITDELTGEPGAVEFASQALEAGIDPRDILALSIANAMEEVGKKFEDGEYFIPDMLASAEAASAAMDVLGPELAKSGVESKANFVIATVQGDQHDIGKNIVAVLLKGAGFNVIDLGVDVPAERITEVVRKSDAQFVGLSALLTTTMHEMKKTIDSLESAGVRNHLKVLIGGAPTTKEFARKIGADAHCKDAFEAIAVAKSYAEQQ